MECAGLSRNSCKRLSLSAAVLSGFSAIAVYGSFPLAAAGGLPLLFLAMTLWLAHWWLEVRHQPMPEVTPLLAEVSSLSPVTYCAVDSRGVIREFGGNGIHADIDPADFVGKSWMSFARGQPGLMAAHVRAMAGEDFVSEHQIGDHWYRYYFFPSISFSGEFQGYRCVSVDLAREQQLEAELLLTRQVMDKTTDAIAVCDARRRVITANHAFETVTGYPVEEVLGRKLGMPRLATADFGLYRQMIKGLKEQGCWQGEIWARRQSGELFAAQLTINGISKHGEITHYLIFCADTTELRRTHDELQFLANHDFLTGLPNRRLFLDRLEQAVRRAKRIQGHVAIYFMDLDNFKFINDTYGHQVGDEMLREVAGRLQEALREVDTVARLAGDEFTVIAENVADNAEIIAVAQKILGCFQERFVLQDCDFDASASVGVAVYPESGEQVEQLLEEADAAMYKAKAMGRDGYYYLNDTTAGRFAGQAISHTELKGALVHDQLELAYQPQVDLKSGEVVGCEALLRWNHPLRGQLLPHEFLPLAEEKGMISEIGYWVASQTCAQLKRLRQLGIAFQFMAINVSVAQLRDDQFFNNLRKAMAANGVAAGEINIEIPEPVAIADIAATRVFIRRAGELGLTCAIDDFGATGESFHYMRELPVRMVKLDQRLLLAIRTGRESQILLKAVVALADVLDFKIVGVGVERSSQQDTLGELGCHYGQGFFYARPISAEALERLFADHPRFTDGQWRVG